MTIQEQIHARALRAAKVFQSAEKELQGALREAEEHKVYLYYKCASLFQYAMTELGLSRDVALTHIQVVRKSFEIPELKKAIDNQELSVSQARQITSSITLENQSELIELAKNCTQSELQREVARMNPEKEQYLEKARYISSTRVSLGVHVSEELMEKIRRVQDLVAQGQGRMATLEETLEAMAEEYLERKDPLRKAKRAQAKKEAKESQPEFDATSPDIRIIRIESENPTQERKPFTADEKYQVLMRDHGQCTETLSNGKRCSEKKWLHIHHIKPVSEGGTNIPENLRLLCSGHHRSHHYRERKGLLI